MDGTSLIQADGALPGDTQADVCIIGAGVAGLTTGYLLAREGRKVVIVDDGPPGMGESLRTTAHLTAAIDDRIFTLERKFGAKKAAAVVQSTLAAIDRIERICQDERLDGIFRRVEGYLLLAEGDEPGTLEKELAAAQRAGLKDVRLEGAAPLPFFTGPALVFPRQGEVDAGEYLAGLSDAIRRMGSHIHNATHALELEQGQSLTVVTDRGRIECEAVVVCTNAPVFGKVTFHTKQEQCRTYVVGYDVPRGWIPRALYWDTWRPGSGYHYMRLCDRAEPGRELLIIGGEDHRTGEDDPLDRMAKLESWVTERFGDLRPVHRWSGQVIEPSDHLPFIGPYPGQPHGVYVITGDSGQGFTNHTIGAMVVCDLVQKRRNSWRQLYRPNRHTITGLLGRLRANTEGAVDLVKGKAGVGEAEDEASIKPGSGAILMRDGKKVACYREPSGELRECAAECTHMGAVVQWNPLERTWDCPWHGSRFTAGGQVVNGPANKPLDAIEEPAEAPRPRTRGGRGRRKAKAPAGRPDAGRTPRATRTRARREPRREGRVEETAMDGVPVESPGDKGGQS